MSDAIANLVKKLKKLDENQLVTDPVVIRQCAAGAHGIGKGKLLVKQAIETLEKQIDIKKGK